MSLAVAFQMDPLEGIDIDADSSFALALEAHKRGHGLYHYLPRQLTYRNGRVTARARPFTPRREHGDHVRVGPAQVIDLETLDVVMMRQDPPFNLNYITATHLLDRLHPWTFVVNDPTSVRNTPEKIFVTQFAELMPATLITYDIEEIRAFRREYGDIIVKPLFGNGGSGIFLLKKDDQNLNSLVEMLTRLVDEPLIAQRYVPEIKEGDKRIILVDGEPAGAFNRVPPDDDVRANLHIGGRAFPCELSRRDQEICEALGPALRAHGLIFTGIDIIGGWLTEINVTSPTGLLEIERFSGRNLAAEIWDAVERRLAEREGVQRLPA